MSSQKSYGQYYPIAVSTELLCQRWTILILRELFLGANTFNDIARGVPRMSRTLLSKRLKELVRLHILTREEKSKSGDINYRLTEAGIDLESIIIEIAKWGQLWLPLEPSVEKMDAGLLMWNICRTATPFIELRDPFVIHFYLNDVPDNKADYWLIHKDKKVDISYIDRGYNIDVRIDVDTKTLPKSGWVNKRLMMPSHMIA